MSIPGATIQATEQDEGVFMVEAEGRSFHFEGIEALTPEVLETFPYEYAGRDAELLVTIEPRGEGRAPTRWVGPHLYGCGP